MKIFFIFALLCTIAITFVVVAQPTATFNASVLFINSKLNTEGEMRAIIAATADAEAEPFKFTFKKGDVGKISVTFGTAFTKVTEAYTDENRPTCYVRIGGENHFTESITFTPYNGTNKDELVPFSFTLGFYVGKKDVVLVPNRDFIHVICNKIWNADDMDGDYSGKITVTTPGEDPVEMNVTFDTPTETETVLATSLDLLLNDVSENGKKETITNDVSKRIITTLNKSLGLFGVELHHYHTISLTEKDGSLLKLLVTSSITQAKTKYDLEPLILEGLFAQFADQLIPLIGGSDTLVKGYNLTKGGLTAQKTRVEATCLKEDIDQCTNAPLHDRNTCFPCHTGECSTNDDCAFTCVEKKNGKKACTNSSPFVTLSLSLAILIALLLGLLF